MRHSVTKLRESTRTARGIAWSHAAFLTAVYDRNAIPPRASQTVADAAVDASAIAAGNGSAGRLEPVRGHPHVAPARVADHSYPGGVSPVNGTAVAPVTVPIVARSLT